MAYLAKSTVIKAYQLLSNIDTEKQQGLTQKVSALKYISALDMFYKNQSKDCDLKQSKDRDLFVSCVGKIVKINDEYNTKDFYLSISPNGRDYDCGSNFFSQSSVKDSKINSYKNFLYPKRSGWKPVMDVQNQTLIYRSNYLRDAILFYLNSSELRLAYVLWLLRFEKIDEDNMKGLENALKKCFTIDFCNVFFTSKIYSVNSSYVEFNNCVCQLSCEDIQSIFNVDNKQSNEKQNTIDYPLQQIYYGAPGTGKSHAINDRTKGKEVVRTTFHPDSDYSTFVGAYKPTMGKPRPIYGFDSAGQTVKVEDPTKKIVTEQKIEYKFVKQAFLKAYLKAWKMYCDGNTEGTAPALMPRAMFSTKSPYMSKGLGTLPANFNFNIQNGATLQSEDIDLLKIVDAFQFPFEGIGCFGDLHKTVKVEVVDKPLPSQVTCEKIQYTIKKWREEILQLEAELNSVTSTFSFRARTLIDEINWRKKRIAQAAKLLNCQEDKLPEVFCYEEKTLLGLCEKNNSVTVWIFMDNINKQANPKAALISTYIHEMFHAYYATANIPEEIEEPLVECSMLCFLELLASIDPSFNGIFQASKEMVDDEKNGSFPYYGFGYYLFCNRHIDWIGLFKHGHAAVNAASPLVTDYCNEFREIIVEETSESFQSNMFPEEEEAENEHINYESEDTYEHPSQNPIRDEEHSDMDKAERRKIVCPRYPWSNEEKVMRKLYAILTEAQESSIKDVFLVIEEINRGNCAQIFGDIFQLLDRGDNGFSEYPIEADADMQQEIERAFREDPDYMLSGNINVEGVIEDYKSLSGKTLSEDIQQGRVLLLPCNLHIWATMNTSDQSLFPMDSAFKRRWDWEYIKITNGYKKKENGDYEHDGKGEKIPLNWKIKLGDNYELIDWWQFLVRINRVVAELTTSEDKQLGYFFCKPDEKSKDTNETTVISAKRFVSKVIFYLWNDVFKGYAYDADCCKDMNQKEVLYEKFYLEDGKDPDIDVLKVFFEKLKNEDEASLVVEKQNDDAGQPEGNAVEAPAEGNENNA